MWRYLNMKMENERRRQREKQLADLRKSVDKVINSKITREVTLDDYPVVRDYVMAKFPLDFSGIKMYLSDYETFKRAGLHYAFGMYIHVFKTVLLQDMHRKVSDKNNFAGQMSRLVDSGLTVEDILVHEMMHVVSGLTNRSTKAYSHMEEEFAYTNTVPYYRNLGLKDEEIVNYYVTFCINDIVRSKDDFTAIITELESTHNGILDKFNKAIENERFMTFADKHADILVPVVLQKGKEKAKLMVELYNTYGEQAVYLESPEKINRAADLDFDLDL